MSKQPSFPAHNIIEIDNVTFSSNFDNGNLLMAEKKKHMEYMVWSACDNHGTAHETKHCTWFYFTVTGLPQGSTVKIHVMNQRNGSLYKFDHRPVFKSTSTGMKWNRIRSPCKFSKNDDIPLSFEHQVTDNGTLHFAFTYPYTYTMVQNDLNQFNSHVNLMESPDALFYQRELLTNSPDGLRIDLITITSADGASSETEEIISGLFPDNLGPEAPTRPPVFPDKEIIFISARVHSGEVPAQHTLKGILDFLMDPNDVRAIEMRRRYVFKLIPILNPDGVYRGHFRCDQYGNNLNRHYLEPDAFQHPSIYAVKHLLEDYARNKNIAMYLDLHAHASKRGCFIYGNVLDSFEQQVQNQLYCKLIALNTAHFDYEGCLFSRDHMQRIDPGDRSSGLTAEGSGRVSTYLSHKLVHSYTLECNYNCSKFQNEVVGLEGDCRGGHVTSPSAYATTSERYTPAIWEGVGRACMVAMLDLRGHNPCSRLPRTRVKTLERLRLTVMGEVRQKSEYRNHPGAAVSVGRSRRGSGVTLSSSAGVGAEVNPAEIAWVSRTDEVFVPKPKKETVSLPKVQSSQQVKAVVKMDRVQQRGLVTRTESFKMKQASISLPAHCSLALDVPCASQQQPHSQPQAPVSNNTSNSNGSNQLKYKRYFSNNNSGSSNGGSHGSSNGSSNGNSNGGSSSNINNNSNNINNNNNNNNNDGGKESHVCMKDLPPHKNNRPSSVARDQSHQVSPHSPPDVKIKVSRSAGVRKEGGRGRAPELFIDGLYVSSLPISPPRATCTPSHTSREAPSGTGITPLTSSESQQSIITPDISFQAPSPPSKSDDRMFQETSKQFSIQKESSACQEIDDAMLGPPSRGEVQVQVEEVPTKAEKMMTSVDSKEFLPGNIVQKMICKQPLREAERGISKIPRSSNTRVSLNTTTNKTLLASGE